MKAKFRYALTVLLLLFALAQTAHAFLNSFGSVDPVNGFPMWYRDTNGLGLGQCLSQARLAGLPLCILLPPPDTFNASLPIVFPTNFPIESFYWSASANITFPNGGLAKLTLAIEGSFANNNVILAGDQIAFARIRIDVLNPPVGGTYTVTHPYGTHVFNIILNDAHTQKFTSDIGISGPPFIGALNGDIGPFLTWDRDLPIVVGGEEFIGDPNTPHTVTGSPFPDPLNPANFSNFFRIVGPPGTNLDGLGNNRVETNLFFVMGKKFDGPLPVPKTDFDRDGKTDIAIYRRSTGAWFIYPSWAGSSGIYGVGFGGDPSDIPVSGDYDGDGKTDVAIYRSATGAWFIYPSSTGIAGIYGVGFGGDPSDVPVPGDYDGDGKTDIAVYRKSTGAWYIYRSFNYITMDVNNLGTTDLDLRIRVEDPDVPPLNSPTHIAVSTDPVFVPAGSGWRKAVFPMSPGYFTALRGSAAAALSNVAELRIYHSPTPTFPGPSITAKLGIDNITALVKSLPSAGIQTDNFEDGTTQNWIVGQLGAVPPFPPTNVSTGGPAGAGDNYLLLTSIFSAFLEPGNRLVVINTTQWTGNYLTAAFQLGGSPGDIPVPGDYDGDGKADIAVYRPGGSMVNWFVVPSSTGIPYAVQIGGDPTDKPVIGDFDRDGKTDIAIYRAANGFWFVIESTGGPLSVIGFGGDPSDVPVTSNIPSIF